MAKAEKEFHRCNSRSAKTALREIFARTRAVFDKELRRTERTYNRKFADDIEELNTEDPKQFWNYINKLGPRKTKDIPFKVYDKQGYLTSDNSAVLDKWKTSFESLYTNASPDDPRFDEDFLFKTMKEKHNL